MFLRAELGLFTAQEVSTWISSQLTPQERATFYDLEADLAARADNFKMLARQERAKTIEVRKEIKETKERIRSLKKELLKKALRDSLQNN